MGMVSASMDNLGWNSGASASDDYEVFINFRGDDTRDNLIDALQRDMGQSGIRCFYDDESMRAGDELSERLIGSIERSQVYLVVLSENYANSKWCLRELTHMVKCYQEESKYGRKVILPVFYGVSVETIKLEGGSAYINDMNNLSVEQEERRDWEEALKKVAKFKGLHKGSTRITDFSQMIVREVQLRLRMRPLSYHLIGIDEQAQEVEDKLDVESGDVRFLVIHGKPGMGKATLARAVFQRLSSRFEGSSFIANVPEMGKRYSYNYLKHKLLRDICGDDGPPENIEKSFRDKKVLIVLDSVDHWDQIGNLAGSSTWFGPRSRIIITTTNPEVLSIRQDIHEHQRCSKPSRESVGFEMKEMKFDQALKLFSRYAFWRDSALKGFEDLSKRIVNYSKRIPLVLEIMGSLLHRKRNREEWRKLIDRLKDPETIQEKLMISYDALQYNEQVIFLDIACFFVNEEKTNPIYMWNSLGDAKGIETLLVLSLVKIVDGNKLWMHKCLRDLGREIVRHKCLFPRERCRFWEYGEASQVLWSKEGQQKVEAICLCYHEMQRFLPEQLTPLEFLGKRMLRFLKLYSVKFHGDFKDLLPELRWLSWHDSPQDFGATHFASAALVILDLARSSITTEWDGWEQLEEENNLKVLDLTSCKKLNKTPIFFAFKNLERVILEDCKYLVEIDCSIGELKGLRCLNVRGCDSLEGLPEQICLVEKLEEILIMKKVKGRFRLPSKIGSLTSLTTLEIVNVKMDAIPSSIGSLGKLQHLSLLKCSGFEELPESVGSLQSMAELQISKTEIVKLPKSIGSLKEVKVIKMEDSSVTQLPCEIIGLKKLEELHCRKSKDLDGEIPAGIENLLNLKVLDLSHTLVNKLPETISWLSHLQKLKLPPCCELQTLSKLPESLTTLGFTFRTPREDHKLFDGLTKLENLELLIPENTICNPPLKFPPQLKSLRLSCRDLQCCRELPSNLSKLILEKAIVHTAVRPFNNLKNLSSLELHDCWFEDNNDLEAIIFGKSNKLMHFYASGCHFRITNGLHLPKDLRVLYIDNCSFHSTVLYLSGLTSLKQLEISECEGLVGVEGLGESASLEELSIHGCSSLKRIVGDISKSKKLKVFRVFGNHELEELVMLDEAVRENLRCYEVIGRKLPSSHTSNSRVRSKQGQRPYELFQSMRSNSTNRGKLDMDKELVELGNQRFKRYGDWSLDEEAITKRSRTAQHN